MTLNTRFSSEQSLRKLSRIEGFQVIELLAHANKVHRYGAQFRCRHLAFTRPQRNGRQHSTFGCTVKLGDDKPRQF